MTANVTSFPDIHQPMSPTTPTAVSDFRSPMIGQLVAARAKAAGEIKRIVKDKKATIPSKNGSGYGYAYADLADVMEAVDGALASQEMALFQTIHDRGGKGPVLVTTLAHSSDQWISSELRIASPDAGPQVFGSSLTYARRYTALAILGLAPDTDDDGRAAQDRADQARRNAAQRPQGPTVEQIAKLEKRVRDGLADVSDLDNLDDFWKSGINAQILSLKDTHPSVMNGLITAFSQKKNEILKRQEADAEAGETPEPSQDNDHEQDAEPAQQVPSASEDAITTATKATQPDQPSQTKAAVSPPVAINVMRDETGKPNWKAFFNSAKAQITTAVDNEYPTAWMVEWEQVYRGNLSEEEAKESPVATIEQMRSQALQYLSQLDLDAATEAAKFPTIGVEYDGDNPDWIKFAGMLKSYLNDTTSHRVARIWLGKHTMQIKNMREADSEAAGMFEQDLYRKFPQLAK